MAESTLTMTYGGMKSDLISKFGIEDANAGRFVKQAYVKFLASHPWSFACPVKTLTMTAAADTSALPDDFLELTDWPSYPANKPYRIQRHVSGREIAQLNAAGTTTNYPWLFAVEPVDFTVATGQRWQVRWWPTPVETLTMVYAYRRAVPALTGTGDYTLGGPLHALTVLEMAYAEWELDSSKTAGIFVALVDEALARSIALDQRMTMGVNLGGGATQPAESINMGYVT